MTLSHDCIVADFFIFFIFGIKDSKESVYSESNPHVFGLSNILIVILLANDKCLVLT